MCIFSKVQGRETRTRPILRPLANQLPSPTVTSPPSAKPRKSSTVTLPPSAKPRKGSVLDSPVKDDEADSLLKTENEKY